MKTKGVGTILFPKKRQTRIQMIGKSVITMTSIWTTFFRHFSPKVELGKVVGVIYFLPFDLFSNVDLWFIVKIQANYT